MRQMRIGFFKVVLSLRDAGSRRGISDLVLLILVTVACVGIITSYFLAGHLAISREKVEQEKSKREDLRDKIKKLDRMLTDISPLIKEVPQYSHVEVEGEKGIRPYLENKLNQYGLVSKVDHIKEIGGEDTPLEVVFREAAERLIKSEILSTRARYGRETSEQRRTRFRRAMTAVERFKENEMEEIRVLERKLTAIETKEKVTYGIREKELNEEKERIEAELPKIEEEFKEKRFDLKTKISLTIHTIERLATLEIIERDIRDIIKAQGYIFDPDLKNRYAFINLGADANIKMGMKFRLFRKDKYGSKRWKGQIEVKKIFGTYSQVSITKIENPLDPITGGDLIMNVFYDKKNPKRVVLVGDIERGDFKYNRAEIQRRLTKLGTIVEKEISLRTDFVIVGKEPEQLKIDRKNYHLAKKLNIPRVESKRARECIEYCLGD